MMRAQYIFHFLGVVTEPLDRLYRVGDYRVVADCIDLVHEVLGDKKGLALNDDMISIFIHSKTSHGTRKNLFILCK